MKIFKLRETSDWYIKETKLYKNNEDNSLYFSKSKKYKKHKVVFNS